MVLFEHQILKLVEVVLLVYLSIDIKEDVGELIKEDEGMRASPFEVLRELIDEDSHILQVQRGNILLSVLLLLHLQGDVEVQAVEDLEPAFLVKVLNVVQVLVLLVVLVLDFEEGIQVQRPEIRRVFRDLDLFFGDFPFDLSLQVFLVEIGKVFLEVSRLVDEEEIAIALEDGFAVQVRCDEVHLQREREDLEFQVHLVG